jgi:hypothetical protein
MRPDEIVALLVDMKRLDAELAPDWRPHRCPDNTYALVSDIGVVFHPIGGMPLRLAEQLAALRNVLPRVLADAPEPADLQPSTTEIAGPPAVESEETDPPVQAAPAQTAAVPTEPAPAPAAPLR